MQINITRLVTNALLTTLIVALPVGPVLAQAAAPAAATRGTTGSPVSFDAASPGYFANFAPELAGTVARKPQLSPETGLYVAEIKPGLFYVTDGIYQSAFLVTKDGVAVFDAPASFADRLPEVIRQHAHDKPVSLLIYSHDHADHIGGAGVFSEVKGLVVVSSRRVAAGLAHHDLPGVIAPTRTFDEQDVVTFGDVDIQLRAASYHSEDGDVLIYLPGLKFLMAVDTITPGEVPFMNFGATSDFGRYLDMFDVLLGYDFDTLLSGHISVLGTRQDVIDNKAYAYDVRDAVLRERETMFADFDQLYKDMDYANGNLAYRATIEKMRDTCAAQVIETWSNRLSVVDIWAESHCETAVLYYIMH